tara:strand:+ start:1251 stop:2018 length:768 start_codon:yes stop_codon:yes gene_type:complete
VASLLKLDIKDLFSRKKNDSGGDSGDGSPMDKTVIKRVLIVVSLALIVFGSYFFYFKPKIDSQERMINKMQFWEKQIVSCNKEIKNLEKNIDELKNASSLKSGLFVSNDEFENFYAELTEATINNGLKIINITRGEEIPVRVADEQLQNSTYTYTPAAVNIPCEKDAKVQAPASNSPTQVFDPDCKGDNCGPIAYYKMTVTYEIDGLFGNYVRFRNVLANKSKIVNIESEKIKKHNDQNSRIKAVATVSLVKNVK